MTSRRAFIIGLTSALAAPAIVRAESLMKLWVPPRAIVAVQGLIYRGDIVVGFWKRANAEQVHYRYKVPNEWNSGTGWTSPQTAAEMFRISNVDARPAVHA